MTLGQEGLPQWQRLRTLTEGIGLSQVCAWRSDSEPALLQAGPQPSPWTGSARKALWRDKSWLLHHDNAPTHTALSVRQFLAEKQTATLDHPDLLTPQILHRVTSGSFPAEDGLQRDSFYHCGWDQGQCDGGTEASHRGWVCSVSMGGKNGCRSVWTLGGTTLKGTMCDSYDKLNIKYFDTISMSLDFSSLSKKPVALISLLK